MNRIYYYIEYLMRKGKKLGAAHFYSKTPDWTEKKFRIKNQRLDSCSISIK